MKIERNESRLESDGSGSLFSIRIKQESDWSMDGGYSFEDVENGILLDRDQACVLIRELCVFCNREAV